MAGFISEERLAFGPWQAIERTVARFIQHYGFKDVMIVGGSGDQGADIVGTINNQRWVFQAKYKQSGLVDSNATREVLNAMSVYGADVGVVVTNQTFSQESYNYLSTIKSNGIDLRYWSGSILLDYYKKMGDISRSYRELRNYQSDAVDAIENKRSEGKKSALLVMATGLGKSIVGNQIVSNELDRNTDQEVLVLAHTVDLVKQLEVSSWPQLKKNCSTHLWTDGEKPSYSGGIVFATWQSLISAIKRESLSNRFGLILVDEAHHAPSIEFSQLLNSLSPNFLVGMTATPWRGDEQNLNVLFGETAYSMDIIDGMQRGFLAEVDYRMLTDGINWDEIARLSRQGYTVQDLNAKLVLPDRDIAMVQVFSEHFHLVENPKAIIFCRSKAHADRLQPIITSFGISAAILHSGLPRELRFMNLANFRAGNVQCLLSVEMLNEGIDIPDVNIVSFMRVTHSRRIFVQQLGRGLRITPGKEKVLVLDFVADIRRIAAGLQMNHEAMEKGNAPEVIRFHDGRVVKFENDFPSDFFKEYLADVADIENFEDGSRLKYPE